MNTRTPFIKYIGFIALIALAIIAWFFFSNRDVDAPVLPPTDSGAVAGESERLVITAKHQYNEGTHIVAGEVNVPTPCHILSTNVSGAGVNATSAVVNFTVTTQGEMCAQVITPARFKVEFSGQENMDIGATWNGEEAEFNFIPVDPGEDLTDFEIFIKG